MRNRFTVRRDRRGLIAAGALMAAASATTLALGLAPASASISPGPAPVPAPGTCTTVEVTTAELVRTDSGPAIRVTGVKSDATTTLSLDAENVDFIRQPEYWPYTVDECGTRGRLVKTPFTADFRVPTNPVGRLGISVNGIQINLRTGIPAAG